MPDFNINAPNPSLLPRWLGRVVDQFSWAVMIVVIGVVIAGLIRRAQFEQSYGIAVLIALFGALVLMIGLAQQAIAARDMETWRAMAEWQLRAAKGRFQHDGAAAEDHFNDQYHAVLTDMMIEQMQTTSGDDVAS